MHGSFPWCPGLAALAPFREWEFLAQTKEGGNVFVSFPSHTARQTDNAAALRLRPHRRRARDPRGRPGRRYEVVDQRLDAGIL
jgi:hypothetical protein